MLPCLDSLFKGDVESAVSNFFNRKHHFDQLSREKTWSLGHASPWVQQGRSQNQHYQPLEPAQAPQLGEKIGKLSVKWAGSKETCSLQSVWTRGPANQWDPRGVVQHGEKVPHPQHIPFRTTTPSQKEIYLKSLGLGSCKTSSFIGK